MVSPALLVFATVFLDLIGFGIVLPLLPSYAASFHVSDTAIGFLVASFSLMQFLLAHWWGRLSDRIGRRPVLLVGLAGSAVSYLLFALATNFWVLLLSRMVAGGMGATVNVAQAYLADVTPADRRARAMGLLGAAFGLGFVVGPALGGITSHFGDAVPGLVASGFSAANFLLAWRWLPESRHGAPEPPNRVPVHWSKFTMAFGTVALSTVAFTVLYVVFPLQVERALGFDRHHSAYLFVLIGLVSAVIQGGVVGRLVGRVGERPLMITGGLMLAGGLALLPTAFAAGPAGGMRLLYLALLVLAAGSAMIGPSAASYVSRIAPAAEQGRALGLLQSVGAVARIGGPILAGAVAGHASARAAFFVASGAAGLAGVSAMIHSPEPES
jgi:DHA1 family tetracycline resistance protein-like MFS transporter